MLNSIEKATKNKIEPYEFPTADVLNERKKAQFFAKIDELLKEGEISANVDMLPGDIIIIPEAWF